MAKILPIRGITLVGTLTGASPQVESFLSGGALKQNEFVFLSSGKLAATAIIGAADTNDLLDIDSFTANSAPLVGMSLNSTTAADQDVKVAVFNQFNLFEGSFVGSATSGTAANIVTGHAALALTHIGAKVSFLLPKVAVNHAMVDDAAVSTNYQIPSAGPRVYALSSSTTGTTPFYGKIHRVDIGLKSLGDPGLQLTKGTIGDKVPRVIFTVSSAAAGLLLYGGATA